MAKAVTLLSNGSATGSWFQWQGGRGEFRVTATWGGGTVKLQTQGADPSGTAQDVGSDTTLTADGGAIFELGPCQIRAHVATASAIYAVALPIPYKGP